MKKWKIKPPAWMFWPLAALVLFAVAVISCLLRGQSADIPAWAVIVGIFIVLARLFSGRTEHPTEGPADTEPHEHNHRLRYLGGMNGFQIECTRCHQRWALHEDYAFFVRCGVWVLGIAMSFLHIWLPVLRLPEPWDRLRIPVCIVIAMYIVHGVTWIFLRGKDPATLIAPEEGGEGPELHTPEAP